MAVELPVIHSAPPAARSGPDRSPQRRRLQARARLLARAGLAWHRRRGCVAIAAGAVAGSVALIAFGADSLIEALAGIIVLWRFADTRADSEHAKRRAQQLIAITFRLLAAYVTVEATITLTSGDHPERKPRRDWPLDRDSDRDAAPRPRRKGERRASARLQRRA